LFYQTVAGFSDQAAFKIPGYGNFGGLRILVSPFMNFNVQAKTTDIMMFNSRNLGALITDKKPHKNIGIEESYLRSACSTDMQVWSSTATLEALNGISTPAGARSSWSAHTT
jgi:hypothetical protein